MDRDAMGTDGQMDGGACGAAGLTAGGGGSVRYEYRWLVRVEVHAANREREFYGTQADLEGRMNELGGEGWRMVHVFHGVDGGAVYVVMERARRVA